jgi:Zn-dependent metalloprotease
MDIGILKCNNRAHSIMKYPKCSIIPSEMLYRILKEKGGETEVRLLKDIMVSERMRARREVIGSLSAMFPMASDKQTNIYDAHHSDDERTATLVRKEGDPPTEDNVVNEVYGSLGATYDLYLNVYKRKSIDDNNMPLNSYIHWLEKFNNAFWNGRAMYYGDGDQRIFKSFTSAPDIGGHELTHGVTQYESGLEYWCDQTHSPGAINESISDVFGSLVKQYMQQQTVDQADWLIGAGIFVEDPKWALRSMKKPGSASPYDKQPAHMKDYVNLPNDEDHDEGGVHINSGIGNYAFYLAADKIGGMSWEKTGLIWYKTLGSGLPTDSSYEIFASHTIQVAGNIFGSGSSEQEAVRKAWTNVGVQVRELSVKKVTRMKK